MKTVREALALGKERLRRSEVEDPELSAQILLAHLLESDRVALFRDPEKSISPEVSERYLDLLGRRERHCPIAYLVGEQEFLGLRLEVTPDVLIPRPETEQLVEIALEKLQELSGTPWAIDVGTGSGCIAIAIAKSDPRVRVLALDRSLAALQVARRNARRHGVAERIFFVGCDRLQGLCERPSVDLVVSNPPYIDAAERNGLNPSVRDFEPPIALFAPPGEPTYFHRHIGCEASFRLRPGGWLVLEVGIDQAGGVAGEIRSRGFDPVLVNRDYAGIERILCAQIVG